MEQKPHKKEELMVANSVLKLAEDLLKVTLIYCHSLSVLHQCSMSVMSVIDVSASGWFSVGRIRAGLISHLPISIFTDISDSKITAVLILLLQCSLA